MDISLRAIVRVCLCVAFIGSLYGGLSLLTVTMFLEGYFLIALITGLILAGITATLLALCGLAWSMARLEEGDGQPGLSAQPA